MARAVGIGNQDFEKIRVNNIFYVDKTIFIKEWWESMDSVTLITRPRRFGKTLNMSMLEKFFSVNCADRGDLFEGLSIWREEKYRELQGTYPVLFISFADVKENSFIQARKKMCRIIKELYRQNLFLLEGDLLEAGEKDDFIKVSIDMEDSEAAYALKALSKYLERYYQKKVIILLDEYDTPMQEAYMNGYWNEMAAFTRSLFNSTFKTNPYLERAIMTGITRVSKESIFSDLNNLKVVTTTSNKYADCFGFTEKEVFDALDEFGLSDRKQQVKGWYDGFSFGKVTDIYNPWSIINFLDDGKIGIYWAEGCRRVNNAFLQALMADDVKGMNIYMNKVALQTFSYFDTGKSPSEEEPERFYHGFVLGMMVELADRYVITSNRESGFGRYDVILEPQIMAGVTNSKAFHAIIIEFKVQDEDERNLSDTLQEALRQIEEKEYQANLAAKGIPKEQIRKYGFAFCGKKVLIGGAMQG